MTTQQLIALTQKKVSGFTASEILLYINVVHELLLSKANYFKFYTDPATGMPPFIATTLGTYEYNLPANARVSIDVFASVLSGYTQDNYQSSLKTTIVGAKEYYIIPTHKVPALGSARAKVIFIDNPPTQTTQFYHRYALKPTQLTAPTIPLDLPSEFHLDLRRGVLALIRDEKYGDASDWQYFETVIVPKVQSQLNAMCRVRSGFTATQPEYRDY